MDSIRNWWIEERVTKTAEKLKARQYDALFVKTKEEASKEILNRTAPGATIGVGGSVTIHELGVLDTLIGRGHVVYDVWNLRLSPEESAAIRRKQMTCDVFLSSVNAITLDGKLVNIDGVGNRVNAIDFGPKKVILVAGYNKIVEDVETAIYRTKNVAAPMNARRLGLDLACTKAGRCVECSSPNRMCRIISIQEWKPTWTDILVILTGEELGF